MENLTISPIGFARTSKKLKFDAPHQPDPEIPYALPQSQDHIELLDDQKLRHGLMDLEGFSHIWLLWWFHKNKTWNAKVLPPRGPAKKRGVFATRSPHRPNHLGLSAVSLLKIEGSKLFIGNNDLVDGTPIFDIKPYLAPVDSFPDATLGWTKDLYSTEESSSELASYSIELSDLAQGQITFLKEKFGVDFTSRAYPILKKDPSPHRTRRISKIAENTFRMGCGAWRIFFSLNEKTVFVEKIGAGYPKSLLIKEEGFEKIPDRNAQLEFIERWK